MFALIDCNNFYASCERVFRPDLNGKPVAILSNNDGCIIARSNEVKALGIPMGAPAFKWREVLEKNEVHVYSSNYALYGDLSARVMNILRRYSPDIEIYSIDEAFLQFTGFDHFNLQTYGNEIRKTVLKSTGIPISIGFAPTKVLAKVANRIAKKFPDKTGSVYCIDTEEKRIKALKWLAVEDIWGIGLRYAKKLKAHNIHTAFNFVNLPNEWVRKEFSVVGLRLKRELEGNPSLGLEHASPKKAIATTRSFEKMYTRFDELRERVSTFAVSCAEKLRKQQSHCNLLLVFVHTNGHRKDLPQYSRNIVVKAPYPTNSSIDLVRLATAGLQAIYQPGFQYKKAGVIVMGLTPEHNKQFSMFNEDHPKHPDLMKTIDTLNKKIGRQKIKLACQDLGRTWKMNQEKLSPRYTTDLREVIVVKTEKKQ
jgi:DNA polymerase V